MKGKYYSGKSVTSPEKPKPTSQELSEKKTPSNWITNSISFFTSSNDTKGKNEGKTVKYHIDEEPNITPLEKIEISIDILKKVNKTQKSEDINKVIGLLSESFNELK